MDTPRANDGHDGELHAPDVAVEAVTFAASKVVRLPLVEHELEPLAHALRRVGQLLRLSQIAVHEALEVGQ